MRIFDPAGPDGSRAFATVFLLGAVFAVAHLRHVGMLLGAGWLVVGVHGLLPLGLAVVLPWLGWGALRSTDPTLHRLLLGWIAVGVVVLGAVGGWALLHVVHHDGTPRHALSLGVNVSTFGAVAGLFVGTYDIQRRTSARRAREQSRRTEEIAEIVSHDLRNVLNLSQGYVELAVETDDVDPLEHARRSHERMETIIDELLVVTEDRPVRGPTRGVAVDEAARDAWTVAGATGDLDADSGVTVEADPDRLRELFEHCFRYAAAHADEALDARVRRIEGGVRVEFPCALPLEVVETTAPREGGFELYLVAAIAEAHGWTVVAEDLGGRSGLDLRWGGGGTGGGAGAALLDAAAPDGRGEE